MRETLLDVPVTTSRTRSVVMAGKAACQSLAELPVASLRGYPASRTVVVLPSEVRQRGHELAARFRVARNNAGDRDPLRPIPVQFDLMWQSGVAQPPLVVGGYVGLAVGQQARRVRGSVAAAGDPDLGRAGQIRAGVLEPNRWRQGDRRLADTAGHELLQLVQVVFVHGPRVAAVLPAQRRGHAHDFAHQPPVRITRTAPRASCVTLMSRPAMNRFGTFREYRQR